jgi:nucleoside-diphosphate-sugar epimerase
METPEPACVRPVDLVAEALRGTDEIVAVTGATGWFGAVALDLLYEALGDQAAARVVGYASSAREVVVSDGRTATVRPLVDLVSQDPPPTTVLHFAFLTRDKVAALGVDAYASQNVAITATVLDAIAKHKPGHVVVASSGAVHSSTGRLVSDLRSDPYGTLKHVDELAFRSATRDAGGVCVIPRVFSVAGNRMTKPGLYALGSMIEMATVGGPIEVRARRPVFRSYCGVDEIVALALWAALSGRDAVFDTCGTVVEVGDLAHLVAQVHGLDVDVVRRTWDPDGIPDRYVGDGRIMERLAAEAGLSIRPLSALVRETSAWLTSGWTKLETHHRERG